MSIPKDVISVTVIFPWKSKTLQKVESGLLTTEYKCLAKVNVALYPLISTYYEV